MLAEIGSTAPRHISNQCFNPFEPLFQIQLNFKSNFQIGPLFKTICGLSKTQSVRQLIFFLLQTNL